MANQMNDIKICKEVEELTSEMTEWRHYLHEHPETAFEEYHTSDFVAEKLKSFGLEVSRGMAKTGVVATLSKGVPKSNQAIAFRADMDALDMEEKNKISYRSKNKGKMHACGHDGHMTMLLGAAKVLSESNAFKGTIHFIFQPAEENEGGGGVMVKEGLFEQFPAERIFGMHNFPAVPAGMFGMCVGPMMAAYDVFDINITGVGGHAAMPHLTRDPVITASTIISQLQTLVSRNTHPLDSAVLSVTEIHGGTAYNIIPDNVIIRGTTRHFNPNVQKLIQTGMEETITGVAKATGTKAELIYEKRYPALVNTELETKQALEVASSLVGESKVIPDLRPIMGSEDFAFMLQKRPGAYMGIGSGSETHSASIHQATYDFNDEILPLGASYWVALAEKLLPC